jgi:hypothetical protein
MISPAPSQRLHVCGGPVPAQAFLSLGCCKGHAQAAQLFSAEGHAVHGHAAAQLTPTSLVLNDESGRALEQGVAHGCADVRAVRECTLRKRQAAVTET